MIKTNNDKFKTDITALLQRIDDNVTVFYNEVGGPNLKMDVCKDIIKTSKNIESLATKQLNIEFKKKPNNK